MTTFSKGFGKRHEDIAVTFGGDGKEHEDVGGLLLKELKVLGGTEGHEQEPQRTKQMGPHHTAPVMDQCMC